MWTKGALFWLLIILAVILGGASLNSSFSNRAPWLGGASGFCAFAALCLVGWSEFGDAVK